LSALTFVIYGYMAWIPTFFARTYGVRPADIALVYGLGFPPFRGGVFRYLDTIGLDRYVAMADQYADLGPLYRVSDKLRAMAAQGKTFY
jgi:3-hydroxyacyl-CoA dehydrogenase